MFYLVNDILDKNIHHYTTNSYFFLFSQFVLLFLVISLEIY